MKKLVYSLLFCASCLNIYAQESDPILMTVGNNKVTLSEFSAVYNKNNSNEPKTQESLEKYLDLFINFKLKVSEALELKMDTVPAFKYELAGYRKQLAQPYLTDRDVNDKLIEEAYERMKQDVSASHILLRLAPDASPKDTIAVYKRIQKIRSRLLKGEDFEKVAKEVSEDESVKQNGGNLGYFTSMQMVYPFESAAYSTKVGEVSQPVRTRFGYHVLKVHDKRPAQGEIQVAHIMVRTKKEMSDADMANAEKKINELYDSVKAGKDFAMLAKNYSDDKNSGSNGGVLPWFGTNRMPVEFEKASFALKANGDISKPVQSEYGWHIIKRLDKKDLAPYSEMKAQLKNKISRDSRSQAGRKALIDKIKEEYKYKADLKARDEFYKVIDTTFFNGVWSAEKAKGLNKTLFTLLDKEFKQEEFADYIQKSQTNRPKADVKVVVNGMFENFVNESCIAFEESRLEEKYPEFRTLMREYKEGILLFELTDEKVWSKAVKDTVGLKEFYESNKQNYMWGERADASVYTCKSADLTKKLRKLIKKKKTETEILETLNEDSQLNVSVESKLFNKGDNEHVDGFWKQGVSGDISAQDGKVILVYVKQIIKPEPKKLNEAKGLITADYQNFLEDQWIKQLKEKYPVNVNKKVLKQVK